MKETLRAWVTKKYLNIALFNGLIMLFILLRSAGYFDPYFPITVNVIIFIALVTSIVLLGASSRVIFFIALLFWLFASFLKIVGINIWAERTAIYVYESLLVGVSLLIFESIKGDNDPKR